jgi:hypothetical protein
MARRPIAKQIEAEEFNLVDATGRLWASLHSRGGPTLDLCDEEQRSYLTLKIEDGRPLINFARGGTEGVVGIGVSKEGSVGIQVSAPDGKPRFMLTVTADGQAKLMLMDKNGESVAWHAP